MICVSFGNISYSMLIEKLDGLEMAEIRIDLLQLTDHQLKMVFQAHPNLIATCRPDNFGIQEQVRLLTLAIDSGAALVDIEIEAPKELKESLILYAKEKGCKVIISYHNHMETPDFVTLCYKIDEMLGEGADIAKIATMATSSADSSRVMALYEHYKSLVAICMGDYGKITRIAAPLLGAPFTFAAPEENATAPGQMNNSEMAAIYKIMNRHG